MARIIYEHQARAALAEGTAQFARAVGTTLGPGGRNVGLLSRGRVAITKDGVTVAREATLADPFPGIAARMVRQASEAVSRTAGDGTTTVAVLTDALLQEGHRLVTAGYSAILLSRAMRELSLAVAHVLKGMAKPVKSRDEIYQIALVSSNGDQEVANLVADALIEAGPKGIVTMENGIKTHCSLRVVAGAQYPTGWMTPELVTDQARMETTFENPYVLVTETHLHPMKPIVPILEKVYSAGRPLLIFCMSASGPALKTMVMNLHKKTLQAVAVPAPYFSDIATESLRDLAALTGATLHTPFTGRRIESLTLEDLGHVHQAIIGKRTTTLVCHSRPAACLDRIGQLERQIEREPSEHEKERLRERLSKLAGAVAVIEIGGNTETELKERRDRFDDALHAARGAMDHGVLPGGGLALMHAMQKVRDIVPTANDETREACLRLFRAACAEPLRRIARNSGANADHVEAQVRAKNYRLAFNARTGKLEDPWKTGILDPAQVPMLALTKAADVASLLLNTGCVILKGDKR
jgi:chaperonin GroEL